MPEARHAPYPADTRAKGWRFELDMEQVRQSDTWALSPAEARPWLLLEWAVAWEQTPCGSLPNDDTLIAARLEMPAKMFAKYRAVLLRGWWLADDGRLYHDTLARRVMEMMQRRRKESDRKALARARPTAPMPQDSAPVPPLSHGTGAGLHPESDTGTGTGTGRTSTEDFPDSGGCASLAGEFEPEPIDAGFQPTEAGAICGALRRAGIHDTNPGHPALLALLAAGAQPAEFTGFVPAALAKAKRQPFTYLLGMVKGERERAAAMAGTLHRGPMPNRQEAIEQRNSAVGDAWLAEQGAA